jgi:hypothetical protein
VGVHAAVGLLVSYAAVPMESWSAQLLQRPMPLPLQVRSSTRALERVAL